MFDNILKIMKRTGVLKVNVALLNIAVKILRDY